MISKIQYKDFYLNVFCPFKKLKTIRTSQKCRKLRRFSKFMFQFPLHFLYVYINNFISMFLIAWKKPYIY